jgi:para-nitrobenzyl esterase
MQAYPVKSSPAAAYGDAVSDIRFSCYMDLARTGMSKYAPIYGFEMNEPDPVQQLPRNHISIANTSFHTSDLAYLFDYDGKAPLTGEAATLSSTMRRAWVQFMRTGDPNGKGLPTWPRFTPQDGKVLNLSGKGGLSADFASRHDCGPLRQAKLVTLEWN